MKKVIVGMFLIVLMGFGLSPAKGDEINQGKMLFQNRCEMCHGAEGKGNGPASAAFDPKPANFTAPQFWRQKNVQDLISETIKNGHGKMPPIDVSPGQAKAIIDYITHTFKP